MLEAEPEILDMHEPQRAARCYAGRASSGIARGGKRSSHAPAAEDGGAEDPGVCVCVCVCVCACC